MTTSSLPDLPLASDFPAATRAHWMNLVAKALKGADFEKRMVSRTFDGLTVEPLYTRDHTLPGAANALPGLAPFARGLRLPVAAAGGSEAAGWDMRALITAVDPKAANALILEDLEGGATSIALAIAAGGHAGLPNTTAALARALDGVLLDICPVALTAFEAAPEAAANLMAVWQARDIAPAARLGSFGADPLGTIAVMGSLARPLDHAIMAAAALVPLALPMPHVTALIADGVPYHNAGASEAEELAAMLATLVAYLRAAEQAGVAPALALPKISIGLAVDADQFLGLAKLRAARTLIARISDACGAADAPTRMTLTAVTSWRMLAKRDPWTNILRNTVACAAAVQGGADAIIVLPFSMPLGQPDALARRLSRNIQIVASAESHLGRVADPAGGSWYIEDVTHTLAAKAWELFQDFERQGGMAASLVSGFIQDRIATTATARAKDVASGRLPLTGVSAFPKLGDDGIALASWPLPPEHAPAQTAIRPLAIVRLAEPYEGLRDAADAFAAKTGAAPTVFLASLGTVSDHTVRTTWAQNTFASAGIGALISEGFATPDACASAFEASGAVAACICASDKLYAVHAESTVRALKAAGAKLVLMAGRPGDARVALEAAGVDEFLAAGGDMVKTLERLLRRLDEVLNQTKVKAAGRT